MTAVATSSVLDVHQALNAIKDFIVAYKNVLCVLLHWGGGAQSAEEELF